MRDERCLGRLGAGGVLAGLLFLGATPAAAQDLYGRLQIQYQHTDVATRQVSGTGSIDLVRRQRETWLQMYEANHQAYPRQDMLLQTQLRFERQDEVTSINRVTTPQGNMRLYHPWFNLYASYKPTSLRSELRTPVGDSVISSQLESRFSQAQFTGHFARPRLPQFDFNWVQRLRSDAGTPYKTYGREATGRVTYGRDWFNVYAGVTQQRAETRGGTTVVPLEQRIANLGGSVSLRPTARSAASLQYDLNDTRAGYPNQPGATTQNHSLNANAGWRFAPRWSADANWIYHHSDIQQNLTTVQNDNEGSAMVSWEPWQRGRVTGNAGLRTLHRYQQPDRYIRYISETVASDGTFRPGWQMGGAITHSNNWDPERGTYAVETFGFTSRMDPRRPIRLDAGWTLSTNSDTALAGEQVNVDWGLRGYLTPLRNLTFDLGVRSSRNGPGWLKANAVSRTRSVGFNWRPAPAVSFVGSYSATGAMPNDSPRNVTRTLSAQYARSERFQLTGLWSKSNQERAVPLAGSIPGRESISLRVQSSLTRRLTLSLGYATTDPGKPQTSRQYDALTTWSFGR